MELLEKLETQIEALIDRVRHLQQENDRLRSMLTREQSTRGDVLDRVERLLEKVQEANNDT
ncbi:MAG: cell division protein ZapB [Desulfohalobiaceae bacterium]